MSKVTVIIPFKQNIKYIFKALKSIFFQTFKDFKILIIYDDSDKTDLKVIKKFLKKNDIKKNYSIKIITNIKNLGAGRSRNIGIKLSKSKYIAFLDSDDTWNKYKLEYQVKFMEFNKISMSHTSYNIVNEQGKKIISQPAKKKIFFEDLIKSCDIGLSTVMLNLQFIKKNNLRFPNIETKEDYILWLKIIKKITVIYGLKKNLTNYRKTNNSLSSNTLVSIKNGFFVYKKYLGMNSISSIYHLITLSIYSFKKKINLL